MNFTTKDHVRAYLWVLFILFGAASGARAQTAPGTLEAGSRTDSGADIRSLKESLERTQAELAETRAEIRELRGMLEQVLKKDNASASANAVAPTSSEPAAGESAYATSAASNVAGQKPAQIDEDDWQILNARIEELHQDKIESASKYRIKLSGLVLLNLSGVSAQVDNSDLPTVAVPQPLGASSQGSVGASLRQTILGLTGFGPSILGASTSADLQMDFFGGLPSGYGADTSGIMRLRVARIRFDWAKTSLVGGLDVPFFSPNMPTTYLSVAEPAFAAAGNLWTWAPAVSVEQRFDTSFSQLKLQAGIMDAPSYSISSEDERTPTPGESSRQPTYAVRFSANGRDENRTLSFGVSGIYSPQSFPDAGRASGWGLVEDWKFPFLRRLELSGEFFAGKGLDGFGGVPAISSGYQYYDPASAAMLARITMLGGWSQLKVKLDSRSEFNVAAGSGNRDAGTFRRLVLSDSDLVALPPRNQMLFVNYIFRPRSDLVFSPEYRRLRTYPIDGAAAIVNQIGLSAGFLF